MYAVPKEIVVFCQVLCGFPLKYETSLKVNSFVTFSRASFIWGVTVITIQTVMSFLAVSKDFADKQMGTPIRMSSNTSVVAVSLDVVSLNLMAIIVFCNSVRQYPRFVRMFSVLVKIDEMMPCTLFEPRLRTKLLFTVTYTAVLLSISLYIESIKYMEVHGFNGYIIYYPFYTIYFVQVALFMQFTRIAYAIVRRFLELNKMLKEELIKQSCIRNLYFCLPDIDITTESSSVSKIQRLIELYWLLCEAVHQANAFYSCQLLVAIFSSFIHIVITFYYFFLHMWPTISPEEIPYLLMQGLWIITHISHLVLLIWPSTAVTEAAEETAPMICKLMNRDLSPEIKKQMAGSVTTYLVILIQFQTSPMPNTSSQNSTTMSTTNNASSVHAS